MSTTSFVAWVGIAAIAGAAACGDSGGSGASGNDGGNGSGAGNTGAGDSGGDPNIQPTCDPPAFTHAGDGTFYDFADGSGNCSFPATPDDLMVGAMNHVDYAASAVCGSCVEIKGPSGNTIKIRVVDQCPECPEGDIDLSPEAFSQLADLGLGRIDIQWDYVPCDVTGPIVYHYKEGSNPYWIAVQIRNHRTAIAKVEAIDSSGNFVELPRADYNFFIDDSGLGEGPYTFRVTDVLGEVLVDDNIPFVDSGDASGAAQFSGCL
ncbi:MAG: expansin EXLX1 family cellulose-binding protein [Polyangiaceae bacterium]